MLKLSDSTDWYPERNQLFRNLEGLKEMAEGAGKNYVVFVAAEENDTGVNGETLVTKAIESFPHNGDPGVDAEEMLSHYGGVILWKDLVEAAGLDWEKYMDLRNVDVRVV